MKVLTKKRDSSKVSPKVLVGSSAVDTHKVWLALGIFMVVVALGVVLLFTAKPEALFGKAVSFAKGDIVASNVRTDSITEESKTLLTGTFTDSRDGKLYMFYSESTQGIACECRDKCPPYEICLEQVRNAQRSKQTSTTKSTKFKR